jgi:hypothetical protein
MMLNVAGHFSTFCLLRMLAFSMAKLDVRLVKKN